MYQLIDYTNNVTVCFIIYIRYSQVKEFMSVFQLKESLKHWNDWALILGLLSSFGLSLVANFQETSVLVVHMIGGFLCFGGGTAYFWAQVRIYLFVRFDSMKERN